MQIILNIFIIKTNNKLKDINILNHKKEDFSSFFIYNYFYKGNKVYKYIIKKLFIFLKF